LLNQEAATGIYKTSAETQRGFCQTFELRPHRDYRTRWEGFLETSSRMDNILLN
jgi:hypothetical protein